MKQSQLIYAALLSVPLVATSAPAKENPWGKARQPSAGGAESIGGYSRGCVAGARELPAKTAHLRVMKPERRRHFGHPALIRTIETLAERIHGQGLLPLAVGDLSQPRGGPAEGGHASHQSGLDVDLWFSPASDAAHPRSMVDHERKVTSEHYDANRVQGLLRTAARLPGVARIFVNPVIKQALCTSVTGERDWLRKLRPWFGHDEHFHLRMRCPKGNDNCENQPPTPAGDGCNELAWWLSPEAQEERAKKGKSYSKRVGAKPELPKPCQAVLKAKPLSTEKAPVPSKKRPKKN